MQKMKNDNIFHIWHYATSINADMHTLISTLIFRKYFCYITFVISHIQSKCTTCTPATYMHTVSL